MLAQVTSTKSHVLLPNADAYRGHVAPQFSSKIRQKSFEMTLTTPKV